MSSSFRPPNRFPMPNARAAGAVLLCATLSCAARAADPVTAHECLIEPMTIAEVGSPVQGIVRALLVERGETVVRGQPLAALESGVEAAALEQAEVRAAMVSEVAGYEAELELATLELERAEELHAQDLVPARQRDEAQARRQVAAAAVVQALENQKLAQIELLRTRRLFEQRTVRSPIDGVVVERLSFPGEFVYDNPIVTVARIDPLRVEVVLPARLFGTLRPGETARVFPELGDGAALEATVDVVDAIIDTGSGTFGVRLTLANADRAIPGGQRCRVAFDAATSDAHGESVGLAEGAGD